MIPKVCYLLLYLLVALVAASPVDKPGQTEETVTEPKNKDAIKKMGDLGVQKMKFTGTDSRFKGYVSHLRLKSDVTDAHIAGLAEAAWWEMFNLHMGEAKGIKDMAKLKKPPAVMTALKVGNEVFLASSLKGPSPHTGGYIYDNKGVGELAQSPDEHRKGNIEFSSVLKETPGAEELMEALIRCREGSFEATEKKKALGEKGTSSRQHRSKRANPKKKGPSASRQPPDTSQGDRNTKKKPTGPNQDKPAQQEQPKPKTGSQTAGSSNEISQGVVQHKNRGACGEIMASLEYYLLHPSKSLRTDSPKPTVVAWEEKPETTTKKVRKGEVKVPTGKVFKDGGGIKLPCDDTRRNGFKGTEGCGDGWGCEAFTGAKGMDFHVVPKKPTRPEYLKKEQIEKLAVPTAFPVPK